MDKQKTLGAILFDDFELLDLYGPLEMFGNLGPELKIVTIAEQAGPIRSAQGPSTLAEYCFGSAPILDFVLVPGGYGTFEQAQNSAMLEFLTTRALGAEGVMSVCSGSGVLAGAGLLDGRKATTNKLFFSAITEESSQVDWQKNARWVEDGNVFTSSGVSAGTDMSLAVIAKHYGVDRAHGVARMTEYDWQMDPNKDNFSQFIDQGNLGEYLELLGKT
ncbi:MAG: transcriptional regulator GlxA family with amidase domain [Gammaproteobacteria bacterium]|jgi:transcriptional regulator GlxA family with amidase domain